jgi:hypothetical protein
MIRITVRICTLNAVELHQLGMEDLLLYICLTDLPY